MYLEVSIGHDSDTAPELSDAWLTLPDNPFSAVFIQHVTCHTRKLTFYIRNSSTLIT
jgi:hypothetical protein